jgi:hypothetical protein
MINITSIKKRAAVMKIKIILALVLTFWFSGCKDESLSPVNLTFEIQPLRTGNTYYYVDSTRLGESWQIDSTEMHVAGIGTITGEVNAQGVAFWDEYTSGEFVKRKMLNLESDGLYHYAEINGNDTLHLRKMIAKYPVNVGDTFVEPRYIYNFETSEYIFAGNWTWRCISVDHPLTIESGVNLICHIYRAQPEEGTEVLLFYALNVGYTSTQILTADTLQYKQILTRYELK